ncbi:hypothetical protein [Arthrobacter sp. NIO-1057]|uniref:hypothetical protein n=1 Tax=Arthrobacter sp. NIO-1057 TaxID=993071 RepID=UPI00071E1200|nr:hypothetical protein [Arthrobacter sp. NIO-1057]KSU65333.1 hypothetical protein AS038_13470 [Arthrobacter sp. NIO-1057]SCC44714.1 hypothetical protein GA0061084_2743 [Arthrobacter sp. NIO-1057]
MEDFEDLDLWIKWTQSENERTVLNLRAEIEEYGYALIAFRLPNQQQFIGTTLGLSWEEHPEIISMAGDAEEVLALLQHLADEVIVHGRIFESGTQSTTFFKEVRFLEFDLDLSVLGFIDEVLQGLNPEWIMCQVSTNPRLMNAEDTELVSRNVA